MAFWAPWSKESLKVKKTLEDLMDRIAGSVRLALVNIETSPVVTSQFAVFSVPCVKFVFQGQIENQILGLHSTAVYLTALKQINAIDPMTLTLEKDHVDDILSRLTDGLDDLVGLRLLDARVVGPLGHEERLIYDLRSFYYTFNYITSFKFIHSFSDV